MAVGGFDPSGSWIGWARLEAAAGGGLPKSPPPLTLGAINAKAKSKEALQAHNDRVKGCLAPMVRGFAMGDLLCIEVLPKKLKKRQHGSHFSGAGVAWWGGTIDGMAWMHQVDTAPVEISSWRRAMLAAAVRWGHPVGRPKVKGGAVMASNRVLRSERLDGGLVRVHRECGHYHDVAASWLLENGPPSCPTCHRAQASKTADGAMRDAWKATAVSFVRAFWPDELAAIDERARARARDKSQPSHTLAGVADACEAVGVAMAAWGT